MAERHYITMASVRYIDRLLLNLVNETIALEMQGKHEEAQKLRGVTLQKILRWHFRRRKYDNSNSLQRPSDGQ